MLGYEWLTLRGGETRDLTSVWRICILMLGYEWLTLRGGETRDLQR